MIAAHRPRVRFQGRQRKNERQNKVQEGRMQAPNDLVERSLAPIGETIITQEPKSQSLISKVATVDKEMDLTADQGEDINKYVTGQVLTFPKERVPLGEELTNTGKFQSILHAEMATLDNYSSISLSALENGWADSPPQSLVLQAPIYEVVDDELHSRYQAEPETQVSLSSESQEHRSVKPNSQNIASFFTWPKADLSPGNIKQHATHTPDLDYVTPDVDDDKGNHQSAHSQRAYTISTLSCSPQLTHRQVVADIQLFTSEHLLRYSGYESIPPAPEHWTTGIAFATTRDMFEAPSMQRGFNVPSSPQTLPSDYRRNNFAHRLLDRKNDVWAQWHTKHPTAESNPFSRK
jgi:hypothetical protein